MPNPDAKEAAKALGSLSGWTSGELDIASRSLEVLALSAQQEAAIETDRSARERLEAIAASRFQLARELSSAALDTVATRPKVAQGAGAVFGRLLDEEANPVEDAEIHIVDRRGRRISGIEPARTDTKGGFKLAIDHAVVERLTRDEERSVFLDVRRPGRTGSVKRTTKPVPLTLNAATRANVRLSLDEANTIRRPTR